VLRCLRETFVARLSGFIVYVHGSICDAAVVLEQINDDDDDDDFHKLLVKRSSLDSEAEEINTT